MFSWEWVWVMSRPEPFRDRGSPPLEGLGGRGKVRLPQALLLRLVPLTGLAGLLNRVLAKPLRTGEMDFLEARVVRVQVCDAGAAPGFVVRGRRFVPAPRDAVADLVVEASLRDMLMLAVQREDPDTLFFQRRLHFEGDTELGMRLKHIVAGLEVGSILPGWIRR